MRAALLALALAAAPLAACDQVGSGAKSAASAVRIGGPFQLVDTAGRPVTDKTLLGKPTVMFFGFTYCPEVCPTTLAEMSAALKALGPDADRLNVVFVTVDPERDTPEQMKLYLSNFDPRIKGFTGAPAQVDAVARAYKVYHQKVLVEGGGYTVDHSSAVYLFDKRGNFVEPVAYGAPHEQVVARLRALAQKA